MDASAAFHSLEEAFRQCARPEGLFIAGTCRCAECEEHNATLASHTPQSMTMEHFGNAGWDPICMASDAAFLYFVPGMFRLAFEDGFYIYQLLFHLGCPNRVACLTSPQARAMAAVLRTWDELHANDPEEDCYRGNMDLVLTCLDGIGSEQSNHPA